MFPPPSPQKLKKQNYKTSETKQNDKRKSKQNNKNEQTSKQKQAINYGARTCDSGLQLYTCVTGA